MTLNKLALIAALTLTSATAFAADGADMLQKRQQAWTLERQQAREQLAEQQKARTEQAASNDQSAAQKAEKPAS